MRNDFLSLLCQEKALGTERLQRNFIYHQKHPATYKEISGQKSLSIVQFSIRSHLNKRLRLWPLRIQRPSMSLSSPFTPLYYRSRLLGSLPGGSEVAGDVRDMPSIPGSGRCPGGGSGNPFQHSGLGNPMDRGAWMSPSPASSFFLYISSPTKLIGENRLGFLF